MKCDNATKFHRKSEVAQWRDLQFRGPLLEMFFAEQRVEDSEGPQGPACKLQTANRSVIPTGA
jgi:hypothetical protein